MSEIVKYSVEIDAEQRDLLELKIAESQMTAQDFLVTMLANYENTQNRQVVDEHGELDQLKNCWATIEDICIGMNKKRKAAEENHNRETGDLMDQLIAAEADLAEAKAAAKTEAEAAAVQMKELEEEWLNKHEQEILAKDEQMKALQEQMAQQQHEDGLELAVLRQAKEEAIAAQAEAQKNSAMAEQALQQLQEQVAELSANFILNQQRVVEAISELNKKSKELSATN